MRETYFGNTTIWLSEGVIFSNLFFWSLEETLLVNVTNLKCAQRQRSHANSWDLDLDDLVVQFEKDRMKKNHDIWTVDEAGSFVIDTNWIH